MSEKLCPCCGNRKGCDCYTPQSPQFRTSRRILQNAILCQKCDGKGTIENDGLQKCCPVCDGNPLIDFQTVASYAQQIDVQRELGIEHCRRIAELEQELGRKQP